MICELPPTLAKTACLAVKGFFIFAAGSFPLPFVGAASEAASDEEPDDRGVESSDSTDMSAAGEQI